MPIEGIAANVAVVRIPSEEGAARLLVAGGAAALVALPIVGLFRAEYVETLFFSVVCSAINVLLVYLIRERAAVLLWTFGFWPCSN